MQSPVKLPPLTTAKIVRKARFTAAHFFWLEGLSEAENEARFGKTSNREGHGHNYELEVTVEGTVDPETGMVMNLRELKAMLNEAVVEPLDFKNLNRQVPFFATHQPSAENMARFLWQQLEPLIGATGSKLSHLRVYEEPVTFAEIDGATPHIVNFTRQYDFCASHRLYNPTFSDAENWEVFGKCNNPNGHGHNYALQVTVAGHPDASTGMVMDMVCLDNLVETHLLCLVDHKDMNTDVAFLKGIIPTGEAMVQAFWQQLAPVVAANGSQLHGLRLYENDSIVATYTGNPQQVGFMRLYPFCASHRLHNPLFAEAANAQIFGKCNNPNGHGHNYTLSVSVCGPIAPETGMVINMTTLDALVEGQVLVWVDHKNLNLDVPFLDGVIPTAENIVASFWQQLLPQLPAGVALERLRLQETRNNFAEFTGGASR